MINRIASADVASKSNYSSVKQSSIQKNVTNSVSSNNNVSFGADKLALAYRGYNKIQTASSISFTGSLAAAFDELNKSMVTCKDKELKRDGEEVGTRIDVSTLVSKFKDDLLRYDDAIKTTIEVARGKDDMGNKTVTDARTQIKKSLNNNMMFEMVVRQPRSAKNLNGWTKDMPQQDISIELEPFAINYNENHERVITGTPESAYILNTKGKLMAVVEDGDNVILTNTGRFKKKDETNGSLTVLARDGDNEFMSFDVEDIPVVRPKEGGSMGGGTEIVIGLENGRFVPEIIESIEQFCKKVDDGEIVLDKFVPAEGAKNVQLSMLAGGFGSRAEYANASSSKIMHGKEDGSNLTKGCFRTATGLTPMETSFISLHKAGLLDCSKGNLGIGKNIKFYLNDSGVNGGNGGFTVDMYNTMANDNRKSLLILPNDAMSRVPVALGELTEKMNSGKAAVVMIAKEVDKEDARGALGIMKINKEGEIEAFAEKPQKFEPGYVDEQGKCFANTFQFAVSQEAFEALASLEEYLPSNSSGKEPRDWSKTFTPILMGITQNDEPEKMNEQIKRTTKIDIPNEALQNAKNILKDQKIYAVKTSEPWADCGTLNALYHTTMQIASGAFPLEDFERHHVLESVDTDLGLVASNPKQKEEIENKYYINGQVMAVPKAKPADKGVVERNSSAITKFSDKARSEQPKKENTIMHISRLSKR